MSQVPGTMTSTKTSTVNGVTTVVTTITTPGQPTRVTTTTTTKVPAGHQLLETQRVPAHLGEPQPQPRPQPVQQLQPLVQEPVKRKSGFFSSSPAQPQQQQPQQQQPQLQHPQPRLPSQQDEPKRKNGFFNSLKKHVLRTPSPGPRPASQQQQQQQQEPTQQQPIPTTTIIRHQSDDGPVDNLAEKMRRASLNRPTVVEHHTTTTSKPHVETHTSSTTTQNGRVVKHTDNNYCSDGPEDSIAKLKKCRPVVAPSFKGERLDVKAIDFSREDAHARACPKSEAATIPRLSHYLTSPCAGDQVSQLRTIFTWLADNIAYDVAGFMSGRYGDQSPEAVLRNRLAVCEGYSNLFMALAQPAGLNVEKVTGMARGIATQVGDGRLGSPHAWNAVTVEGEYLLIDSTWGAGVCDMGTRSFKKLFRPFFFLLRPNKLIYTHWPENPRQQYLDPPIDEHVFRDLPAVKPESWELGIKLAGKNRGQVITTQDDYVELEIRLKKRPFDGCTGKIVARLNWKGQALPTACQWLREDEKYVWMVVKGWCPSSGAGELHVFGWPPGGDQTKNGPQCISIKVQNEGSGRAAKPLLQQYVVKGFAFSVLEPLTAQVKKNTTQVIRVRVFDVEPGVTPALAIQGPDGGMPERLPQVQFGVFETKKVMTPGKWKIVNMTSEYAFSFAAVFEAV
ncbi:hypothetical protein BGZ75_001270 [Mortierella antarctica]|nr:hypothetical protein BGZ75_001270 [Mortierella antarctica]